MGRAISPHLEPETRRFVQQVAASDGKPIWELTPEEARRQLVELQKGAATARMPADLEDRTLPAGPRGSIALRIVRPKDARGPLPVVMYFHGGGWVLGNAETHDRLVRELANRSGAAVVFVDYSRAPEAQFPTQIEEAWAATRWIADHGDSLGLDPSRLAVAGDSAGGNMATVVALLAKERGGPELACQILFYPVTDARFDTGSYREFADDVWLGRREMEWYWDAYLPDASRRADPHASPLRASDDQLRELPPALIVVAENDVLRDEGEAYARRLAEVGVPVEAVRVLGTMHDFVLIDRLQSAPAARAALRLASETLRRAFLGRRPSRPRHAEEEAVVH